RRGRGGGGVSAELRIGTGGELTAWQTLRRGMRVSPQFGAGIGRTLLLALAATTGRVVVPIAVQQTIDRGLRGPAGPDLVLVRWMVALAAVAVLVTAAAAYAMNVRL